MRSKKLLICLVFLFVSLFAFGFNAKVNAIETSELIKVEGAQVRTTGNAGIRFVATEAYEGENETYGILLAFGEAEADENFVVGGTVNGESVANAEIATAENGQYAVTLYDIPQAFYIKGISARAYVKVGETYVYSSTVCVKSLAEVALKGKADGVEGTLIDDVATYVEANYKYVFEDETKIVLGNALKLDVNILKIDFINDVNAFCDTTLSVDCTMAELCAVLANVSWSWSAYGTDITAGNAFKFFQDEEMGAKWSWLMEYLVAKGAINSKLQAFEILDDGIYSADQNTFGASKGLFGGDHAVSEVWAILNRAKADYASGGGSIAVNYSVETKYDAVNEYFATSGYFKDSLADRVAALAKVGKKIALPAALEKDGYTWNGWNDGTNSYEAGAEYAITSEDVEILPSFTAVEYTVKFIDEGIEYEDMEISFTIEEEFELPLLPNLPGYTFAGWYENEECTGEAVTKVAKGTTVSKVLYAKWIEGYDTIVVNQEWASLEEGTSVEFDGAQYTLGSDAQATLDAALEMIQSNGTIYLAAGTYTKSFTISLENLRIVGPNATVAGNGTRAAEAIFKDSVITLAGDVVGTELVGLAFTGTSQIIGNAGAKGASTSVATYGVNHENFLFENNYVEIGLTSGSGFVVFSEASNSYTTGAKFLNNYFTFADGVTETTLSYVISLNNTRNIYVNNNVFEDILTTVLRIDDASKGLAGTDNQFNNNKFTNVTGSALWFHFISPDKGSSGGVYQNNNNVFDNVSEYCINFAAGNNNDPVFDFQVKNNTFKGTYKVAVNLGKMATPTIFTLTGNTFETEATSMYFANDDTYPGGASYYGVVSGVTANAANNTYPEGYDTAKFTSAFVLN